MSAMGSAPHLSIIESNESDRARNSVAAIVIIIALN